MTIRQRILKTVYPLLMKVAGKTSKKLKNQHQTAPPESFYNLKAETNTGKQLSFDTLQGKNVLIVNTASNCGFTPQYDGLQELYEKHKNDLIVLGFPANDFKEQEAGSDEEIAQFCKVNYGVTFPIMKKSHVVKEQAQHPVFNWLSDADKNGWCSQEPTWNFCKYLIDKKGNLVRFYDAKTEPCQIEIN